MIELELPSTSAKQPGPVDPVLARYAAQIVDPLVAALIVGLAAGAISADHQFQHAIEYVAETRKPSSGPDEIRSALELADAALGAEGLAVSDSMARGLGARIACGTMTPEKANLLMLAPVDTRPVPLRASYNAPYRAESVLEVNGIRS